MTSDGLVGVVVVTHGPAGGAMLATIARLLGAGMIQGMTTVDVEVGQGKTAVADQIAAAVAAVDSGAGVLIACDLHGSTPANCAVELMGTERDLAVISGVSLPMLIKLATAHRGTTPAGLAQAAIDTAIRSTRVEGGGRP
jgi:mannose/fructose-specific phosphotransferase system component IIA